MNGGPEYRVEELAARAGVRVDTVRYYQSRGLLPAPRRQGRVALYDDGHLARLRRIRALSAQGLTLALIGRVLEREAAERKARANGGADEALLDALAREHVGGARTLTRAQLAREAGLPEPLVAAAQAGGLLEPLQLEGDEPRFSEADLEMARAGLAILQGGFPLDALLQLASRHDRATREVTDAAIDLFDDHVRRAAGDDPEAAARVTEAFQRLLPQVTRLVALHFQRTLIHRALHRLAESGSASALREALAATEASSLEVAVTWR